MYSNNRPSLLATMLTLSLVRSSHAAVMTTQRGGRELDIVQDWAVKFVGASHLGGNNVLLEFERGSAGSPAVKIYGHAFDPNRQGLIGETCLSLGGTFLGDSASGPPGVTLVGTDAAEPNESGMFKYLMDIQIDSAALAAPLVTEVPNGSVVQYCIWFSLLNAAGEEANFVEVELRFVNSQDGTIVLESFDTASALPVTRDFATTIGLEAKICKKPTGPGDTVEICISTTDPLAAIETVQDFSFSSGDGSVVQNAFTGGAPNSLTQVVKDSGSVFTFETILQGDFYLASTKKVTSVGIATLSTGAGERRILMKGGASASVTDVPMELVFELGQGTDEMRTHDFTATPVANNGNSSPALTAMIVLSASLLVLFIATVGLTYGRRRSDVEEPADLSESPSQIEGTTWV